MSTVIQAADDDVRLNMAIVLGLVVTNVAVFVVLPLWLLPASGHFGWLLVPLALLTVTHWATIHEAIHGNLHRSRRMNDRLGRLLSVLFGSPFQLLRFGHLSHHALNGSEPERPDLHPRERDGILLRIGYYLRLLAGLYAAELFGTLACLLPRRLLRPLVRRIFYEGEPAARQMADRAERRLLDPDQLARTRLDAVLIIALFAAAFWLYGAFWPLLALALLARAFLVSFMDNAPHYAGAVDDRAQGYDMAAPGLLGRLILNSNLHGTHHRHPSTPWRSLPAVFEADGGELTGNYLTVPWRQLRGPIAVPDRHGADELGGAPAAR